MGIVEKVVAIRNRRKKEGGPVVPDVLQAVSKGRVREVLSLVNLGDRPDAVDAVFALLDDETESWFSRAPNGTTISSGATTAHIGCHVGILQRGRSSKLDREGRDYWIKPLREIGAIEAVTLMGGAFLPGHLTAKSSNSAYRLADEFVSLLRTTDSEWRDRLASWLADDAVLRRFEMRRETEAIARSAHKNEHSELIAKSVGVYAKRFLPDYGVIYVDDGDGDRITDEHREKLQRAGVDLQLADASPDVLLWSETTDRLWVIEAVTSDGEVDFAKVDALTRLAQRSGKAGIGFTTAYPSWKFAARRQGTHQNIAVNTYIWIAEDPGRALLVTSLDPPQTIESVPLFDLSPPG